MPSIPKHTIFLVDTSVSMHGPKMDHARESVDLLLGNLSDRDFVNVLFFDDDVHSFVPVNNATNTTDGVDRPFQVTPDVADDILDALDAHANSSSLSSNLTLAISAALELDGAVWRDGHLPENAYTLIVLLTDGRSYLDRASALAALAEVKDLNKLSRIPVIVLGMGFDANADFLHEIPDRNGGVAVNVIEDFEVEPQLEQVKEELIVLDMWRI